MLDVGRTGAPNITTAPIAGDRRPPFIFHHDESQPTTVEVRQQSIVDRYDVRSLGLGNATTVLYSYAGTNGAVFPFQRPTWEGWFPEIDLGLALPGTQPVGTVQRQIQEIQRITGLVDVQLAAAFPGGVSRETVNRWRNRAESHLRPENVYRLGVLFDLSRRMEEARIDARVWLHQHVLAGLETPYDLICGGRLGDVRTAVESVAVGVTTPGQPISAAAISRSPDRVQDSDDREDEWSWTTLDEDGPSES